MPLPTRWLRAGSKPLAEGPPSRARGNDHKMVNAAPFQMKISSGLSFPEIISARSDDAAPTERA